ncbi:MAG: hypothetical protein RLY11_1186 [Bacteroidota bacterium]|jgi:predicted nuclease with TOPRIM domain|nr:hypothetical protein [Chitinophagia bacterium]
MSNSFPSAVDNSGGQKTNNKNNLVIILVIALIASWAYFFYARNEANNVIAMKDADYATLDSTKNVVQKEYDDAMVRLEQMTATNSSLDSLVKSRDEELNGLKTKFKTLVNKQNATSADLNAAKKLVGELNGKIDDYINEIARLQKENKQLTTDKENLTSENKNLSTNLATTEAAKKQAENKVDVGSTLNASSFSIKAINEKSSGKERETASSKRADKLRIAFNLDANRITVSGAKQLFIVAKDPTGKTIKEQSLASGSLSTREDGQVEYTTRVDVDYKQGESKYVSFDLRQAEKYTKGSYTIIVYQNGFKIGEGLAILK